MLTNLKSITYRYYLYTLLFNNCKNYRYVYKGYNINIITIYKNTIGDCKIVGVRIVLRYDHINQHFTLPRTNVRLIRVRVTRNIIKISSSLVASFIFNGCFKVNRVNRCQSISYATFKFTRVFKLDKCVNNDKICTDDEDSLRYVINHGEYYESCL